MKKRPPEKSQAKWKTIRVRRASLALMHAVLRDYSCPASIAPLWRDDEKPNDSRAVDIACRLASEQITGKLFERMQPEMKKGAADIYYLALVRVAALFGATVQMLEDGSAVIRPPDGEDIPVPAPPEVQLPRVPTVH